MVGRRIRFTVFTISVVALLVTLSFLPASAQLSQWQSLNPTRDGRLQVPAPFLYGVHLLSPNYGWAVGGNCSVIVSDPIVFPCSGFVLSWDGTRWRQVLTPPNIGTLTSVYEVSANDVWAVGTRPNNDAASRGTIIHWDGTSWVSALAPANTGDLYSVFMLPGGADGWAVGNGTVDNIRWSGSWPTGAWSPGPVPDLSPTILRSVNMLSPTSGWIVGRSGSIFKWDGAGWIATLSPTTSYLYSVNALDANNAWAVGGNSTIIKWNGASWTGPMIAPTVGLNYTGIRMISASDGWITSALNPTTSEGTLLRWNGAAWSIVRSYVTVGLNGLTMLPDGTVGAAVGDAETIIRWNGTDWYAQTSPTYTGLRDVFMAGPNDGWAVGLNGRILRYNGVSWHHYETLPSGAELLGLYLLNSNEGWTVGGAPDAAFPPTILRWNGAAWSVVTPTGVALGDTLQDVHMLSPTEGWAVGGGPYTGFPRHSTILKWDGTLWTSVPSGAPTNSSLMAVHMLSPTEGWAVGFGDWDGHLPLILRWNGAAWSMVTSPAGIAGLFDLYMLSPTDGWAVGFAASDGQATIIHWDGTQWRRVPGPVIGASTGHLTAIKMINAADGWAVGRDLSSPSTPRSLITHWDGVTWNVVATLPVPPTLSVQLDGLFMTGPLDGWAVGEQGIILHYGPDIILTTVTSTVTSTAAVTATTTAVVTSTATTATATTTTATTPVGPEPTAFWWLFLVLPLALLLALLMLLFPRRRRRPVVYYPARPLYPTAPCRPP